MQSMTTMRLFGALFAAMFSVPAFTHPSPPISAAVRTLHDRMLVLDTHLDIAARFDDPSWRFGVRHVFEWDGSQTDLPRMIDGGLDGGFFVRVSLIGQSIPAPIGASTTDFGHRQRIARRPSWAQGRPAEIGRMRPSSLGSNVRFMIASYSERGGVFG